MSTYCQNSVFCTDQKYNKCFDFNSILDDCGTDKVNQMNANSVNATEKDNRSKSGQIVKNNEIIKKSYLSRAIRSVTQPAILNIVPIPDMRIVGFSR